MKRFCFPIIFSVCVAGCLVETGCATVGKLAHDAATAVIDAVLPFPADADPPPPPVSTPEAESTALSDLVPETVPTWMAGLGALVALVLPSKGVAPIGKALGRRMKQVLGVK